MLLVQSQTYREQYGWNSIFLLPVNLYGPRDNFDPESSHVIPALIRPLTWIYDKRLEAKARGDQEITAWGQALAGEIKEFTGVSSPYEEPEAPELVVESDLVSVEDAVEAIMAELAARGILGS